MEGLWDTKPMVMIVHEELDDSESVKRLTKQEYDYKGTICIGRLS